MGTIGRRVTSLRRREKIRGVAPGLFSALLIVVALACSTSGCLWFHKPTKAASLPAPPPHPKVTTAPVLLDPPNLSAMVVRLPPLPAWTPPRYSPPPPRTRRAAAEPKPVVTPPVQPPETTTTTATAPTQPAPRLGQIYTPEQVREYTRTLDESLDRVKKALVTLGNRSLNAEQKDTLDRILTFQKQAEQAREQDLVAAVNLAKRADLLARDLLDRFQ